MPQSEQFTVPNAQPVTPDMITINPATIFVTAPEKGGEGGGGGAVAPPLPPLNAAPEKPDAPFAAEGVFWPAPKGNPVVGAFKAEKLYVRQSGQGSHVVTCPFADQHEGEKEGDAIYTEPDEFNSLGRYTCPYRHGERVALAGVLEKLDIDTALASGKPRIHMVTGDPGPVLAAAEYVLSQGGDLYQSNGALVTVRKADGDIRMEVIGEQQLTIRLTRVAYWQKWDGRSSDWIRTEPNSRFCQMLLKGYTYRYMPELKGLARQPYLREEDGELVIQPGYDPVSRIYAEFPSDIPFAEPTKEEATAALARMNALLDEFPFASEVDRSAALCAMLTAATRATLAQAPAFNVTAASPGSGKSYLSATIIPFAGPGQPLNMSYPSGTEEASKALPAALIQNPAVIAFDDMQGDWVPTSAINRVLTSPTITERQLGTNRTITASTRTFIIGTGNNIGPVRDMTRRVVSIRLASPDKAALRAFKGNPVAKVTKDRERYVADALTIVRAYRTAGSIKADVPPIGSFEQWSDTCRQPLIWLGLLDPATSLIEQIDNDPDMQGFVRFLHAWDKQFGSRTIKVRDIAKDIFENQASDLADAVAELPVWERGSINNSKLGWFLRRNMDRPIGGFILRQIKTPERLAWRLDEVKPSP